MAGSCLTYARQDPSPAADRLAIIHPSTTWTKKALEWHCQDRPRSHWNKPGRMDWHRKRESRMESRWEEGVRQTVRAWDEPADKPLICQVCRRSFQRRQDIAGDKCLAEQAKPTCDQVGATQCPQCHRWFRSRGGLATHRCSSPLTSLLQPTPVLECTACGRTFHSRSGQGGHKCESMPTLESSASWS